MRVLVVDDDPSVRTEIGRGLEASGVDVVGEAADGIEAERLAASLAPDAVVLDLAMPARDGLQLLPVLRRDHPEMRLVVLSGLVADRLRGPAAAAGADAYLAKGCGISELVEALAGGPARRDAAPAAATPDAVPATVYEEDRAAIAARLHDGPVQLLTAVSLRLQSALMRGALPLETAEELHGQVDEAARELRAIMALLSAPVSASADGPARPASGREARARSTLLVVDDEPVVRELVREIMADTDLEILTAAGAEAALALLDATGDGVDVLLTDMELPGTSGAVLAAEVAGRSPGTEIVCMSGYGRARVAGLPPQAHFLQKPFAPKELVALLNELLGRPLVD
jgi:DNA-binding NarL/FixJ family response regulator